LLAANGAGGWLGAEVAYAGLMPALGLFGSLGALAFLYFLCSWVLRPAAAPRWTMAVWSVAAGIMVVLNLWSIPLLPAVHPQFAPYVLEQTQGREGALAVLQHPGLGRALLVQNQYLLGSSRAAEEQARMGEWPLRLHPDPRRVAFLGVATGITPGAALRHPAVEEITAVEISSAVVAAAERWFAEENAGLLTDPRARVLVEDARTWLAAQPAGSLDVIVSDLFLPWGPGDGRLYSLEHFRAARRALREGGLFALWLPLYQLTNDHAMVILRTFLEVFPEAHLMLREEDHAQPVLGVLGWKNPDPGRSGQVPPGLAVGTLRRGTIEAPINTLGNLWLEWQAGRTRLLQPGSAPYLEGERGRAWISSLRNHLAEKR
jgi:spermidine synthase